MFSTNYTNTKLTNTNQLLTFERGVPLNQRFKSVGNSNLSQDSLERSSSISFFDVLDCNVSNSFSLYEPTKVGISGRQLFPEYWFYGAMESIPFLQNCAFSLVTEEPNLFDKDTQPWKNVGMFYDEDVNLLDQKVKFSLDVEAPFTCFEILQVCEEGVKMKEKFHVDRLTSYEGIPVQVWRDLCNEEARLCGESRPIIDYGKFLDLRYIYALKYASRRLKIWVAILFTFLGSEKLRGAFYEDVSEVMIRDCPFIVFRDEAVYKKCRPSCNLRCCMSCLLRLRNDDMARAMIEAVDHRRLIRYYYLHENNGSRKRISLRLELENMAPIVSFTRWACIIRFLQYAPPRSYDNVMQFFFTTPRNYGELEAFEKSFPRASMTNVHSFGMMMEFIRERTFGEIKRGHHDIAFESPFSSVINVRAMVYKAMDFVKYFDIAFHKIKDPNYFREYGRQDRSLRNIGRLHPRSYYTPSEFERYEMDDFSIGCEVSASIVAERIRCSELEYTQAVINFDYKRFRFPGKRLSRSRIVYEPHGNVDLSRSAELVPVAYRTSFGMFPSTAMSVLDYNSQAEKVVEGDPEKLVNDIFKIKAFWKMVLKDVRSYGDKGCDEDDCFNVGSIEKAVEEISTDNGWIDTESRDCVPFKMNSETIVFARFNKLCECKKRCSCIPRPYLMDSVINVVRSPFSVNKVLGTPVGGMKYLKMITLIVALYHRGRFLGMGVREECNVFLPAHIIAKIESRDIDVIFYDTEGNVRTDVMRIMTEDASMDVASGMLQSYYRYGRKLKLKGKAASIKWSSVTTRAASCNTSGYYILDAKLPSIQDRMLCGASEVDVCRYDVNQVVNIDKDFIYGDVSLNPGDSGTVLFDKNGVAVGMYLGRIMYVKSDILSKKKLKQATGKSVFIKFSAIDKCLFLY